MPSTADPASDRAQQSQDRADYQQDDTDGSKGGLFRSLELIFEALL
jgi:hypothetical protein